MPNTDIKGTSPRRRRNDGTPESWLLGTRSREEDVTLKDERVVVERWALLSSGMVNMFLNNESTRKNRRTVGSGVFCVVLPEAIWRGPTGKVASQRSESAVGLS